MAPQHAQTTTTTKRSVPSKTGVTPLWPPVSTIYKLRRRKSLTILLGSQIMQLMMCLILYTISVSVKKRFSSGFVTQNFQEVRTLSKKFCTVGFSSLFCSHPQLLNYMTNILLQIISILYVSFKTFYDKMIRE